MKPSVSFVSSVSVLLALSTLGAATAMEVHAQSARTDVLDARALPLGDGRISAEPKRGYVFSCM